MDYVVKNLHNVLSLTGIVNVHFFDFQKDFTTKDEKHPFYEVVFVANGELMIYSDDYRGILTKNEMILHKPNESHSLSCSQNSAPSTIIFGFTCDNEFPERLSSGPLLLKNDEVSKLADIIKEAREVFLPPYNVPVYNMKKRKNPVFGAEQALKMQIESFLIQISRDVSIDKIGQNVVEKEFMSIDDVVRYIDNNYKEKMLIDELAFLFHTNRSTLCKKFKNLTGKSIVEYISDLKLQSAKELILTTDMSFTEISDELNFQSIHYFTRFFKKNTGKSPSAFKKDNKN